MTQLAKRLELMRQGPWVELARLHGEHPAAYNAEIEAIGAHPKTDAQVEAVINGIRRRIEAAGIYGDGGKMPPEPPEDGEMPPEPSEVGEDNDGFGEF